MAHGKVTAIIPAPSAAVFDLLHDYDRRLEWDTLLRAAYLDDGFTAAAQGATSVCVGRWSVGGFALKTVYVTFDRPKLAAVKLVNRPPFFDTWAASIRHEDLAPDALPHHLYLHLHRQAALAPLRARTADGAHLRLGDASRLRALAAYFRKAGVAASSTVAS